MYTNSLLIDKYISIGMFVQKYFDLYDCMIKNVWRSLCDTPSTWSSAELNGYL